MLHSPWLLSVVVGCLATVSVVQAADPSYYPMEVGNEWHYKVEAGGNTAALINVLSKKETIDGVELYLLQGKMGGNAIATEHLKETDQGVFRHRNNGMPVDPPFPLLVYPLQPNTKREGKLSIGESTGEFQAETVEEEVETPAGKFKAARVRFDLAAEKTVITYWFAPGVGIVKQTIKTPVLEATLSLTKHTLK